MSLSKLHAIFVWLLFFLSPEKMVAQDNLAIDSIPGYKIVSAGPQYKSSGWHRFLWGKNYRREWAQPVKLPLFFLNKEMGGLIPQKKGGGHQTTSLHLETNDKKNYSLRSVDKRLGKVLPKEFLGTWIEDLVNDEVSMSHPYAAAAIPYMAEAAGIFHTNPEYVFLPAQPALDSFNNEFAGQVFLFEQRVKGNWKNADNLGNFDDFIDTEELIKKLFSETEYSVDQAAYLKDRLFDMFINDWDRHEDQWSWGEIKDGDQKIFVPVPVDRDQAFFTHNGLLLNLAIAGSGMGYFQSFKDKLANVEILNYEERGSDRLFTNRLTAADWDSVAANLKASLTDQVIESAVAKLPPEIFKISGEKTIKILKGRRDQIPAYAKKYYYFLAKEVEIVGTSGTEYFDVNRLNDRETQVELFNKTKDGYKKRNPFYSRIFLSNETKEIRLFGLSGEDVFTVTGEADNDTRVRLIAGIDKDSIIVKATGGKKIFVYDSPGNELQINSNTVVHLGTDTTINSYVYRSFVYDKKGIKPTFFYDDPDRFYLGLGYGWEHHAWRKIPYVFKQDLSLHYSLSQNAMSLTYRGLFPNTPGKMNLDIIANADAIRWTNFFGLGNETILETQNVKYNRMRSREINASVGLNRKIGKNFFAFNTFFRAMKIVDDPDRYTHEKVEPSMPDVFNSKNYAGALIQYKFTALDNVAVPTSGIAASALASFTQNVSHSDFSFFTYGGKLDLYLPLISKFSLAISSGASTVSGTPEFFQYPSIGGGNNLRGFQRERFYGKTAFYNSNELRFISNVKTYLMNGKAGLLVFVDDGRVWMPGEKSDTWHVGYGAGILVAPFNKLMFDVTYGISKEDKLIQLRISLAL